MRIEEFDFSVNLLQALLWQYNDAERLQSLLQDKQAWYDINQTQFWNDWVRDVFDLRTANDFGLSVWSIILDIPLSVVAPGVDPGKPTWGFGIYNQNFGSGNFSSLAPMVIPLTTEQKRLVLRLRYYQLTTRGAVTGINQFLADLFKDFGRVWVEDNLDMTITYVFGFSPSASIRFILDYYDLLPRPAGVGLTRQVRVRPVWGFGVYNQNFNNGNFVEEF